MTGIEDEEALVMVGLPKKLKLNDVQPLTGSTPPPTPATEGDNNENE